MKNIVWLASFPRSGNTWLRLLLSELLLPSEKRLDLSSSFGLHCANRRLFEETIDFPITLLSVAEVNALRPSVYKNWATAWSQDFPLFVKVHDCFDKNHQKDWLFPSSVTLSGIYIIRNPLDVCVSYAHFWGLDGYAAAADMICDPLHAIPKGDVNLFGQLYQHLGDWSHNVRSWTHDAEFPLKVVKYEDMKKDSLGTLGDIVHYLGFSFDETQIRRAVERCQIGELQKQERDAGFKDRPYSGERFFRQGEVGAWQNILPVDVCNKIIHTHREMMCKFGYLSSDGLPLI